MPKYAPKLLHDIFERIAGGGLWVPQSQDAPSPAGPAFTVYLKHSELFPTDGDQQSQYWELLQSVPVIDAIGIFATISNMLALSAREPELHRVLHEQFLERAVADRVAQHKPGGPAISVVFHRLGNIAVIRNLLLYGAGSGHEMRDPPVTSIGTLALLANGFVQQDPVLDAKPSNLDLATLAIGTWDVHNVRDIAYALPRMHTLLTELLPGSDPLISDLRSRVGIEHLSIDGLTLAEFVAVAFGLFAHGRKVTVEGAKRVVFDPSNFLKEYPYTQQLLTRFLTGRALSISEFAANLGRGVTPTREQFEADLSNLNILLSGLTVFRQHPLLRLDDGRIVILDLQFVTDLLTSGVYWLLFDSLPSDRRESFRELWGRAFELYVTGLLSAFYPCAAQILSIDVTCDSGQIDALLDFGPDVFVLEIKSSLLTELAKRSGDPAALARDAERKFVRNERGDPKGVAQLARAARAIASGQIRTATAPKRIYSVLVTDEPGCECFAFNSYLNEHFQRELEEHPPTIRPLTVISINEFEELLPYVANGAFSWAEILETRLSGHEVRALSVHQAIYDLRHARGIPIQRNEYLLARFESIYQEILSNYRSTA